MNTYSGFSFNLASAFLQNHIKESACVSPVSLLLPLAAVLAALAVWGIARARRTPADTVRAEFRALYKKMCRCGLSEGVSSDQEEFKQFLWEHTKTTAPQDVETLLALVQTAQFAPGPVSAQTAQQVRGLCRILRKNLHR